MDFDFYQVYDHEPFIVAGEVMTVNMSGRPMSTPSGIGNDNQKRAKDPEAETTPELPSPRVRDGMTEYDGSVYSYDVTRAGLACFFISKGTKLRQ